MAQYEIGTDWLWAAIGFYATVLIIGLITGASFLLSIFVYIGLGIVLYSVAIAYITADSVFTWLQSTHVHLLRFAHDSWSSMYIFGLISAIYVSLTLMGVSVGFEKPLILRLSDLFLFSLLTLSLIEFASVQLLKVSVLLPIANWIETGEFVNIENKEEADLTPPPITAEGDAGAATNGATESSAAAAAEVFHIQGNKYTYKDAQNLCSAYGAKLASYDQVEAAYQSGGEWCEYGWSENQSVFFPVQKQTWTQLQEIPGREQSCGRPGVNGGFVKDKELTFGVNCFGVKPGNTANTPASTIQTVISAHKSDEQKREEQRLSELAGASGHSLSWFNFNKWSLFAQ